jgi:iron complex outermembrane receptor protein
MGDWLSRNPDLGMTIGLPDSKMGAFVVNAEYPLSEITTYAFGDVILERN